MHVVFNGLARALLRGLKQWPHVHIKAQISKCGGHHLGTTVMAVLTQFGDHHAWPTPEGVAKRGYFSLESIPALSGIIGSSVHTSHLLCIGAVAPKNSF